jgi:hypothetical protein
LPNQADSGCSWSKAADPSIPSTSNHSRFFRPAETCEMTTLPIRPLPVRKVATAVSSVVTSARSAASAIGSGSGVPENDGPDAAGRVG